MRSFILKASTLALSTAWFLDPSYQQPILSLYWLSFLSFTLIHNSFQSSLENPYWMMQLLLCYQSKSWHGWWWYWTLTCYIGRTLHKFRGQELHVVNIFKGIGVFMGVFTASTLIGVLFGIIVALMLKYTELYRYPSIETCVIALMAYSSYLFSNGAQMSGTWKLIQNQVFIFIFSCSCRHCHLIVLWYHTQALRLWQHVSSYKTCHQIRLSSSIPIVWKLYLYLSWCQLVHTNRIGL